MEKIDKVFAIGAVAAAALLGGVLYAAYPDGFVPYNTLTSGGATSTASSSTYGAGAPESTTTAASNSAADQNVTSTQTASNNTADQNATSAQGSASNTQPSGGGY